MTDCPQPTKSRYATREGADVAARRVTIRADLQLRPYECVCTWWHLTKGQPEALPNPADADTADVQRLAALPDIDFRDIVAHDVRGEGQLADRAAIRHPANLGRWRRALGQLMNDIDLQLRERSGDKSFGGHDWRRKACNYRVNIAARITECQRYKAEAHVNMLTGHASRKRDAEVAAAAGATIKELRHRAGDVAIERLIEAHHDEFNRYLAAAYADLGIELPARIKRRMPHRREPKEATS